MGEVQLFVIRVWRHLSQFRASVRSVEEEEPHLFTAPEEVGEYLLRATQAAAQRDDENADAPWRD